MRPLHAAVLLTFLAACSGDDDTSGETDTQQGDDSGSTDDSGGDDSGDVVDTNRAPTAPAVFLLANPSADEDLTCRRTAASTDPDDDELTETYSWSVNGVAVTSSDSVLPAAEVVAHAETTCTLTTSDGKVDTSASATTFPVDSCRSVVLLPNGEAGIQINGDPSAFDVGTSQTETTFELWTQFARTDVSQVLFAKGPPDVRMSSGNVDYAIFLEAGGKLVWGTGPSTSGTPCDWLVTPNVATETWYHLAFQLDQATGEKTVYANGELFASCTGLGTKNPPVLGPLTIGTNSYGNERNFGPFYGLIDEVRVSDTVRYSSPFTPAAYHLTDPNTLLLMHLSEEDGTDVIDDSGNGFNGTASSAVNRNEEYSSCTAVGRTPDGCASVAFDATNGGALQLSVNNADPTDLDLADRPHARTVELWFMPEASPTETAMVLSKGWLDSSVFMVDYAIELETDGSLAWAVGPKEDDCSWLTADTKVNFDQWNHVAGQWDPTTNTTSVYLNGALAGSCVTTFKNPVSSGSLTLSGLATEEGIAAPFTGLIDELRVSDGLHYSADFEPATRFDVDDSTIQLIHFDEGEGTTLRTAVDERQSVSMSGSTEWSTSSLCDIPAAN